MDARFIRAVTAKGGRQPDGQSGWRRAYRTWKMASRISVTMADRASEPRHPRRFEKKKNISMASSAEAFGPSYPRAARVVTW
jgi:hypothetical protein